MTAKDIVVRRYKHGEHILVAEMCRPNVKNAFNYAMCEQLIDAVEQLNGDDSLHALVITGHGDFFTSGAEISERMFTDASGALIAPSASWTRKVMDTVASCPKLVVAAVNGRAIGIGVTLLLHCDFVYAVEHATFWTPFMRIGIVPEFASSFTFPHMLGPQLASDMLMRSRVIDVKRAAAHGLVGHVLPATGFLEKVLADVEPMVSVPLTAKSLPAYKSLMRRISEPQIREAMHQEFLELDRRLLTGETQEAFKQVASQLKPKSSKL